MGKISEIMLLKQPKQSALVVEVQTDMNKFLINRCKDNQPHIPTYFPKHP